MSGAGIVGVLLAAGIGRRFDPSGARLKLLEPAPGDSAGQPLAAAALRRLAASLEDVVAVVRPADTAAQAALHALLQAGGAELVVCAEARSGMGHSIACGVAARANARGWVIALADMPSIAVATIAAVRDAIAAGEHAAVPVFGGRPGHPVGFAAACREELLALTGDRGARQVLAAHAPLRIKVEDPGCLVDIDTPTD